MKRTITGCASLMACNRVDDWKSWVCPHILKAVTPTWFREYFFHFTFFLLPMLQVFTWKPTTEWLSVEMRKQPCHCMTLRGLKIKWTKLQPMSTINVPMNTRHWFSCWCFNWIELKSQRGWPFQWPLSMELCLEHSLMNDPGVRGWSGQPCLTLRYVRPWGH